MNLDDMDEIIAHQIRDGIVQAHLELGHDLNAALDIGDLWDGTVLIIPAEEL
jgi:hypothetical protein